MPKRKRFKINYSEGDCFLVPLENGSYVRGVVARFSGDGKVFSFFFLPKYEHIADAIVDDYLTPVNSLYVGFHSDLGLLDNRWKVFGKISPWIREDWVLPVLGFTDPTLGKWGELRYYDEITLQMCRQERVPIEKVINLPNDGCAGDGYIEGRITHIIQDIELIQEIEQKSVFNIVPTPQSGDIIEIKINDELVYAQYINKPIEKFGHYIRVFEDRYKSKPVVEDILKSKEQFQIFFFLDFELKNNNVEIIANSPIPENMEQFPTLKLYRDSENFGRFWYIRHTDGSVFDGLYDWARCKNDESIGPILPKEYYNYPLCQIVNYDELIRKIETGWKNDTEVYVGNKFLETKPLSSKNNTNLSETNKSKKETPKKKWITNPIKKPLQRILNRLDTIAQSHGEVTDTDVRDVLHSVVWEGFIDMKKNYSLPDNFAMFSKSGNKKVRTAIEKFLESVRTLSSEIPALKDKESRFEAFQDIEIQSKEGSTYDEYFGDSDKC
ncbi:MAG: immunity 26/phosphotriesterase HocA family protein [Planctomycetaceae bacterium]|jgi:hypothetical protein|nr:immunity 26/phosphotriesterase HocA family protein [Planctomycetaceae bacterium]